MKVIIADGMSSDISNILFVYFCVHVLFIECDFGKARGKFTYFLHMVAAWCSG